MSPSWEQFLSKHAQVVLDSALRVVTNPSDAEDVAQEVFLEILRTDRLVELYDQQALLRTMATRRGLDRIRSRRPTDQLNQNDIDCREREPVDYSIAAELSRQLQCELANLPPREAEVFCLTYFENLSRSEIAALLSISSGAVAKSLSTARKRLSIAFDKLQIGMNR